VRRIIIRFVGYPRELGGFIDVFLDVSGGLHAFIPNVSQRKCEECAGLLGVKIL
jgi:hypothetical protein